MKTTKVRTTVLAVMMLVLSMPVFAQLADIDYMRPLNITGVNMFETPKTEPMPFDGLRLRIGAGFTQQFQALSHSNSADVVTVPATATTTAYNSNELIGIGPNFNNATANLNLDVQLAQGIRVSLVTYLSSRHHQETWVKGGYIQMDQMPFLPYDFVTNIMNYTTIKIGHMEINYGDAHFRRSDNGNAIYNPFVGNLILDAFTTEIGTEIYGQYAGFLGMVGITNGAISGDATAPEKKSGSLLLKGGFDSQINEDLRVRLTASYYQNEKSQVNSLYHGDRTGSRYYWVMENTKAVSTTNAFSGNLNPGFSTDVASIMVNPFVKFNGLEVFGVYELAKGKKDLTEVDQRTVTQIAADVLYRFSFNGKENLYVGGRYNKVSGKFEKNATDERSIDRIQVGGGWFFTPNILTKLEYVIQNYNDYQTSSINYKGKFDGVVLEAVVAF